MRAARCTFTLVLFARCVYPNPKCWNQTHNVGSVWETSPRLEVCGKYGRSGKIEPIILGLEGYGNHGNHGGLNQSA